jgi:hypothetical protein
VNHTDLTDWTRRAATDLREYAAAATEAGSPQPHTQALLDELDDILAGRPIWQRRVAERARPDEVVASFLDDIL